MSIYNKPIKTYGSTNKLYKYLLFLDLLQCDFKYFQMLDLSIQSAPSYKRLKPGITPFNGHNQTSAWYSSKNDQLCPRSSNTYIWK